MILATDNWYTSIMLAIKLLEWGIYLFGTARVNKQGCPKKAIFKKSGADKKDRGDMNCERTQVKVEGFHYWLYFISWMDNKPVHFISTFFSKYSQVMRVVKEGMRYVGHQLIKIPTIAMIYNNCMGGTDSFDQLLSYYRTTIKTKRWQTRIFTHFLMCAVVNAHILYKLGGGVEMKEGGLKRGDPGYDLLGFITLLVDQLVSPFSPSTYRKKEETENSNRYTGVHEPLYCGNFSVNGEQIDNRRFCACCRKRVRTFCNDCKVPLCFKDCWKTWHTAP